MRKTVMQLIAATPAVIAEIPLVRWHQAGSIKETPVKPFGIYRLAGTGPGVTRNGPAREVRLELWIHDEPGSYLRIDKLLTALESTFQGVTHASAEVGDSITQAHFDSRSPDLDDTGFGSICKATIHTVTGKGQ